MPRILPEEQVMLVYRETIRTLYGYVSRRVGGDLSLAEDLVQETWMRALRDWSRKGTPNEPLAWLLHVARNLLVSHFRSLRPQLTDTLSVLIEDEKFSPADPDRAAIIGWGMAQLRRSHAEVLEAFYFEGKAVHEIAAERSLSGWAVEGRLRRARSILRKKLNRIMRPAEASRNQAAKRGTENVRHTPTP